MRAVYQTAQSAGHSLQANLTSRHTPASPSGLGWEASTVNWARIAVANGEGLLYLRYALAYHLGRM